MKSSILEVKPLEIFDTEVLDFLDDFSKTLLKQKQHPELIALGFWLRGSHIQKIKEEFFKKHDNEVLLPRGVVFHIAPSNVDTIFIYSLVVSMLVGNINILRVSDKKNPQVEFLLQIFNQVLQNHQEIKQRVFIYRYGYDEKITKELSSLCDVRIIWGGDETIKYIRTIPIKPTSIELTFADKFSYLLLDMKNTTFDNSFYEKLYRDSFTFLQNACSSVRVICFLNATKSKKERFWDEFEEFVKQKHPLLEAKHITDKLTSQSIMATSGKISINNKEFLNIVKLQNLQDIQKEYHCGFGLFYDVDIASLEEFFNYTTKKDQTVVVSGIEKEEILKALKTTTPKGVDRVVKLGDAMEFNYLWDGFDMLSSLCRIVDVDI
jgi:hypothetical protein